MEKEDIKILRKAFDKIYSNCKLDQFEAVKMHSIRDSIESLENH